MKNSGRNKKTSASSLPIRVVEIQRALDKVKELLAVNLRGPSTGFYYRNTLPGEAAWAPELFDIFGLNESATAPTPSAIYGRVDPRDVRRLTSAVKAIPGQNESFVFEYRIMHPQRGLRRLRNVGGVVATGNAAGHSVVGTLTDITNEYVAQTVLGEVSVALQNLAGSGQPQTVSGQTATGELTARQFSQVDRWVQENLEGDISVKEMARIAGRSPHDFAKAFKSFTSLSPYQFVLTAKLERAKALLCSRHREKLAAVATKAGFFDQAHLHRHFRKKFGLTPTDFLKTAMILV